MIAGPRGITRVFAMARPRRPESERLAVLAAASGDGSAQCRAARLARAVTAYLGEVERTAPDDVTAIARRLAVRLAPSPVEILATDPMIDTGALIRRERVARFEARECRQASPAEWEAETRVLLAAAEATLAERYARILRAAR